jgi:hypothetical protein
MEYNIGLGVFRRLDNRQEGLPDDSPRALELHNRRKAALHSVFDRESDIRVADWGQTDDSKSHEFVELSLAAVAGAAFHYAVVPGLQWLGQKLAEKAVDTALAEVAKAVVAKLRPKQEAKQVLDIHIALPDGTTIRVDPPDAGATINVTVNTQKSVSINYVTGKELPVAP